MSIVIENLVGPLEYPPTTFGHLIKEKWVPAAVGETVPPTFLIPITNSKTKDPWFSGKAPAIIFRRSGNDLTKVLSIGDGLDRVEVEIQVHIFARTQAQEFKYQKYINDLIKLNRIAPILKYSENPTPTNSGWKELSNTGINWREAPDGEPEDIRDQPNTHSLGSIKAIWFEHKV